MARDLIAIMDEISTNSFGLDVHIKLPKDVTRELEESAALRERAARDQSEAARLLRNAACHLHSQGLPLRDVGIALGVSYQRAHQLVDEAKHLVEALSQLSAECQTSAARTGRVQSVRRAAPRSSLRWSSEEPAVASVFGEPEGLGVQLVADERRGAPAFGAGGQERLGGFLASRGRCGFLPAGACQELGREGAELFLDRAVRLVRQGLGSLPCKVGRAPSGEAVGAVGDEQLRGAAASTGGERPGLARIASASSRSAWSRSSPLVPSSASSSGLASSLPAAPRTRTRFAARRGRCRGRTRR
jgi:hypothetical protein